MKKENRGKEEEKESPAGDKGSLRLEVIVAVLVLWVP